GAVAVRRTPVALRRSSRTVTVVAALAFVFGAGVAAAASLGVTSAKLTVSTYASSITPTTCSLNAADNDSYVNQSSAGSNFGTVTTLSVRSSASANMRTFV